MWITSILSPGRRCGEKPPIDLIRTSSIRRWSTSTGECTEPHHVQGLEFRHRPKTTFQWPSSEERRRQPSPLPCSSPPFRPQRSNRSGHSSRHRNGLLQQCEYVAGKDRGRAVWSTRAGAAHSVATKPAECGSSLAGDDRPVLGLPGCGRMRTAVKSTASWNRSSSAYSRPVKHLCSALHPFITICDQPHTGEQGAAVSSGTSGEYWADKALPSVFKHDLLRRYLPQFDGMTGTQSHDSRVVGFIEQ